MDDMFEDARKPRTAEQKLADKQPAELAGDHPSVEEAPRVFGQQEDEPDGGE